MFQIKISLDAKQAIPDILDPATPTNLVVFTYMAGVGNELEVVAKTEEDLSAIKNYVKPDNILFIVAGKKEEDGSKKIAYIAWCGSKVPRNLVGRFSDHASDLGRFAFKGYSTKIMGTTEDQITEQKLNSVLAPAPVSASPRNGHLAKPALSPMSPSNCPLASVHQNNPTMSVSTNFRIANEHSARERVSKLQELRAKEAEARKNDLKRKIKQEAKEKKERQTKKAESLKNVNSRLSFDQVFEAVEIFEAYDLDEDGIIDMYEFMLLKDILAPKISNSLWQSLAEVHYRNMTEGSNDQGINLEKFLSFFTDIQARERNEIALQMTQFLPGYSVEQIEKALIEFEKYDLDNDGTLDKDEFYQMKEKLYGPKLSKLLLRHIVEDEFNALDVDTNNGISEIEFVELLNEVIKKKGASEIKNIEYEDDVCKIFTKFKEADSFEGTLQHFEELKEAIKFKEGDDVYQLLKEATKSDHVIKAVFNSMDIEKQKAEYDAPWVAKKCRALVVGAGPAGLRAAIFYAMLGADVSIIEKRRNFTRLNLLHLWDNSIRDLKNIGAKFFYGMFCAGGINHVSIRHLQLLLTKIALINGVHVYSKLSFGGVNEETTKDPISGLTLWLPKLIPGKLIIKEIPKIPFNWLCGADGAGSVILSQFNFGNKILKGSEAIGITTNFVNGGTKEETALTEFGLLACYDQKFFGGLKEKHGIDIENLVYYRGDTHYFVMTAKRSSLIFRKVIKHEHADINEFLGRGNIDTKQLDLMVRDVANYVNLPETVQFCQNSKGNNDTAIFDFSSKRQATEPYKLVFTGSSTDKFLVHCVGDSSVEPFWPLGTGANRAILGAADSAWTMRQYFLDDPPSEEALKQESDKWFSVLTSSGESDLQGNFGRHTIDPSSRYKNKTTLMF
jgi:Ca2+-binding EF-hand superfamily protein